MAIDDDLARIALQERRLRFDRFDAGTAWEIGSALKTAGEGKQVAIDIATHAQPLFSAYLAGTTPDNVEWVRRKRNVTLRFSRSSYAVGLELQRDGRTLAEKFGLQADNFMAHGGAFPIRIGDLCVGAITVSGLPQRDDHDMVTRTLAAFLGVSVDEVALD